MSNMRIKFFIYCFLALFFNSCAGESNVSNLKEDNVDVKAKPLNISVLIDLSDRVLNNKHNVSSVTKDLEIYKYLTSKFKAKAVAEKIVPCKDKMEVFFYPVPSNDNIIKLSNNLSIDLGKADISNKRNLLVSFEEQWGKSLTEIYNTAVHANKFDGSDIYGFMSKKAKTQCVLPNYRNILIVISDGYVYDKQDVIDFGNNEYSYITTRLLHNNPQAKLHSADVDLSELEVLLLEVDEFKPGEFYKLQSIWTDWMQGMKVKKFHVAETELPNQIRKVIDSFLAE